MTDEMIEIVIKIPKKKYDWLKQVGRYSLNLCENAIMDGIVLPKGHGRLLILDEESVKRFFVPFGFSCQKWISEVGISNATLKVIEADEKGGDL